MSKRGRECRFAHQRLSKRSLRLWEWSPANWLSSWMKMEDRGLIERRENPEDRHRYALHITEKGGSTLTAIGQIALEHSQALLAALSEEERRQLTSLLLRIADQQGLTRGVHPGFGRTDCGESNSLTRTRNTA